MTRARDLADSADKDIAGTLTLDGLTVDGGTIKLDGNYPTGTGNVALGNTSLSAITTGGNYNTAVGANALKLNTSGNQNAAFGFEALRENTTGYNNTAVGLYAGLSNTTGLNNVAVGTSALNSNTTASSNTALGYAALLYNTTASNNTAVGMQAGYNNTTGSGITAVGYQAGYDNTTGTNLVFMGVDSGANNTTGQGNTFLGRASGLLNTTGSYNCFVGQSASSGYASGYLMTTGSKNTILGAFNGNQGGLDIRTSSNNIVLSDGDGNPRLYIDSSGNVIFSGGTEVPSSSAGGAAFDPNTNGRAILKLGTASTNNQGLAEFFNPNGQIGGIVVNGSATSYNTSSDHRLKENVVDLTGATTRLKQLEPKRFNFIADADTTVDGFLAHEVQSVVPEAITGTHNEVDADGNPVYQGIDQSKLVPLLVATIKELEARITALENA